MKKFGLVSMLLGALLFISLGVTTASASGDKCGDGNKILQKIVVSVEMPKEICQNVGQESVEVLIII